MARSTGSALWCAAAGAMFCVQQRLFVCIVCGLSTRRLPLPAVYEDCKMTVLRWELLPSLGHTLLRMADLLGAVAHADHYCRDLGLALGARPAAASAAACAPPADIFRALQQLLQGQRASGKDAVPLLAQQGVACVQRSCDLLAAYSLLADSAASISSSVALEAAQVGTDRITIPDT